MSATCVINELIIMEQQQKHIRCRSLMRELVFLKTFLTNLNRISSGVTEAASLSLLFTSVFAEETWSVLAEHPPLIFHRDGWPQLLISTYLGVCARALEKLLIELQITAHGTSPKLLPFSCSRTAAPVSFTHR